MDEKQVQSLLQQMQQNQLVQLKLIQYMETEIEALKAENAALRESQTEETGEPR